MKARAFTAIVILAYACSASSSGRREASVVSGDSGQVTVPSMDSVRATLSAYSQKRITAEAAAKIIVDYVIGTGQDLNVEMDAPLRDAMTREMRKRQGS